MVNAMTVGMRIDAAINDLNNLSSTQLYALIVVGTCLIATFLLGNGDQQSLEMTSAAAAAFNKSAKTTASTSNKNSQPEPRWYIFRMINYAMLVAFVASVANFVWNYAAYAVDSAVLLRFLLGWSACLIYFFGFFGVSFVHDVVPQADSEPAPQQPPSEKIHQVVPSPVHQPMKKKVVDAPCPKDAPVCTDPSSFVASRKAPLPSNLTELNDAQVASLVLSGQMKDHELEKRLDCHRAVDVRRLVMQEKLAAVGRDAFALQDLPTQPSLDYSRVHGANCEIVVGYVPLPVGMVGPLRINDMSVYVPMATTEGCLVASANRGCKAISVTGARAIVLKDGITRAPCVRMPSAMDAAHLKLWCDEPTHFARLKAAFESTTSFGKLKSCSPTVAGRNVYIRLVCFSGDAMGMNMVSKGSLAVIELLRSEFPELKLIALSGNMCTDKKAAATNWLEGRGKSVVTECTIPKEVVHKTLKTTVPAIVETNINKNLIGSAMAGTIGGFNAHAANIVTAVFLATGQDPAQNVESSNCITLLEATEDGDLHISCTMPSLEVGTVGGGTTLPAQAACLKAMGCQGGDRENPGANAQRLALITATAVMAGELSLIAALAANTLVQAHMAHNRKK
eukprot:CAMPEP_0172455346 /NCGR_PEP_ID=MMETSP1065-20121228/12020_1 /TAXON_ID=265537 /ORGANISM="Amphiprora paludosa, Strain CCMP125" /LENGTH=621 /DNA_ID=CAMNT_0013207807 /DNA_START=103 /DNA_END=1968 /DNA_ORIENTATION=+